MRLTPVFSLGRIAECIGCLIFCAAVVELVDTLDSKSGEPCALAGSSPARGTKY
jgi:hypothetical protein